MNINPVYHKWVVYAVIVLAVGGFFVLIGFLVIKPIQDRADQQLFQNQVKIDETLQVADSLKEIIPVKEKVIDSIKEASEKKFVIQKRQQKSELTNVIKKYEQAIIRVDTLAADVVDSLFSKYVPKNNCNR